MSSRHLATAAVTLVVLAALTACSATPASTAAPTSSATTTPSVTPTPTDAPAEQISLPDYTCETILPDVILDEFSKTKGFDLKDDFVDRMRALGSTLVSFVDYSGVLCQWGTADKDGVSYGFSPITEEQSTKQRETLKTDGFVETSNDYGVLVTNPDKAITDTYQFTDGYWFYASDAAFLTQVVENAYAEQ